MRLIILAAAAFLAIPAHAQQQPDQAFVLKLIPVLQAQRDQAANAHANAETRATVLAEESVALKARIADLEKRPEACAPPPAH